MSYIDLTGTEDNDQLTASDGANYRLSGYGGNDTLTGANGNDALYGGAGDDVLHGGAGDDLLHGGSGANTLDGGTGNDIIRYDIGATFGADSIDGGAGYDRLIFDSDATHPASLVLDDSHLVGMEMVQGGNGNDTLDASAVQQDIELVGGAGNDVLTGGAGRNILHGDDGNDVIYAGNNTMGNNNVLYGGNGDDQLVGGAGMNEFHGNAGNDTITGGADGDAFVYDIGETPDGDTLDGGGGWDVMMLGSDAGHSRSITLTDTMLHNIEIVVTGSGNDTLDASSMQQGVVLDGGDGDDVLLGGAGDDSLNGGVGHNVLIGGAGNDSINFDNPADALNAVIDGGDGYYDTISFNSQPDTTTHIDLAGLVTGIEVVYGGGGNDELNAAGLSAPIQLTGYGGDDVLTGGSGDDILDGRDGNDVLLGNAGNDQLWAWEGADSLTGGSGSDTFIVAGYGTCTVTDFTQGQDQVRLINDGWLDFDTIMQYARQVGEDTVIDYGGTVIVLQHVGLSTLQAIDFVFG